MNSWYHNNLAFKYIGMFMLYLLADSSFTCNNYFVKEGEEANHLE